MKQASKTKISHEATFEKFWQRYPKKRAKKPAYKAWCKLKLTRGLFAEIMQALQQHKRSEQWQRDNGRFIPLPTTWINQERWTDVLEVHYIDMSVCVSDGEPCKECKSLFSEHSLIDGLCRECWKKNNPNIEFPRLRS